MILFKLIHGDIVKLKRRDKHLPIYQKDFFMGYMHPRDVAVIVDVGPRMHGDPHCYVRIMTSKGLVGEAWSAHLEKLDCTNI